MEGGKFCSWRRVAVISSRLLRLREWRFNGVVRLVILFYRGRIRAKCNRAYINRDDGFWNFVLSYNFIRKSIFFFIYYNLSNNTCGVKRRILGDFRFKMGGYFKDVKRNDQVSLSQGERKSRNFYDILQMV